MNSGKRVVLVTGSRQFQDEKAVHDVLSALIPHILIHGGASGVDSFAESWYYGMERIERGFVDRRLFPVTPDLQAEHGFKKAPLVRNTDMVNAATRLQNQGENVVVLAFPHPGQMTGGTFDTMSKARRAGLRVLRLQD